MEFRKYQTDIIEKGTNVIGEKKFVYLSMEVRTGKTLTSLGILNNIGVKTVLFITKKKAIDSIYDDFKLLDPVFSLLVVNYESLHKVDQKGWDAIVCDEAHSMGAFPKPSKRAKQVKEIIIKNNPFVIFLSGTPTPESFSQMYHQVYGLIQSPFSKYTNFKIPFLVKNSESIPFLKDLYTYPPKFKIIWECCNKIFFIKKLLSSRRISSEIFRKKIICL